MRPLSALISLLPAYALATSSTHGVPPNLVQKYTKNSGTFSCLDGSKQLSWAAVNDDYCDCPDGSDEPGTGACHNTTFYCLNSGHIGATISGTRVNDGLCEPECCDGSDEPSGTCPNICEQVGQVYKQAQDADRKLRKTGSKIRSSYIAFAQKEKKRLEALVSSSQQEIDIREKEVARLRDIAEQAESLSAAAIQHKKASPLYKSLQTQTEQLKSLLALYEAQVARTETLGNILDALRTGYNPNYQDMAVLEAVRGWEQLAGLPHINDASKDDPIQETENTDDDTQETIKAVGKLLETDHMGLLMEHEKHVGISEHGPSSLLFDLSSYVPDFLLPEYESAVETVVSWLSTFGITSPPSASTPEDSRAREALNQAESALSKATSVHKGATEDLSDLFDPEAFGKWGEWKKLQGLCLEKDTGDYTYEVCLFGEAKQKPNKGGSNNSLGHYASWNPDQNVAAGSKEYYQLQAYRKGAKCWNGPQRSVNLHLTCGIENELLTVSEPEKCEYMITGTSPALCVHEKDEDAGKDEL